jgi:hypothetical protein
MPFRVKAQDYIAHIGTPRHSGRYPWGSGKDPQRSRDISALVKKLETDGFTDKQVAEFLGFKHSSEVRDLRSVLIAQNRAADAAMAQRLLDKGMSKSAIAKRMGKPNESSIRALLDPVLQSRNQVLLSTMDMLRTAANENYIDVGLGTESTLGINRSKLNAAVTGLRMEGYEVMYIRTLQVGTGKYTSLKVLVPPGTNYTDVSKHTEKITELNFGSKDRGVTYDAPKPPVSVSSSRILVRHLGEGGEDKDGLIELRRGPADISLGAVNYAQVRIAVDGSHYLKGMAVHTDNIPKGYDIIFNTSKPKAANKLAVMKPMKADKDGVIDAKNPFGALIKANGQRGALNIVNEQGDWVAWSNTLSSQVLSKQSPQLAHKQLGEYLKTKQAAFDEINSITNPVLKSMFMRTFADECDSAAVDLKGAALPRQANHVILPLTSLKPNQIYAPSRYNDGEEVVLIRHPHGGIFEIPKLVVNNKNLEGRQTIGNARDAVGIHPSVAKKLSGADFDGDTALVIPVPRNEIRNAPVLKALQDFDNKQMYPPYHGMKTIDGGQWDSKTNKVDYGGKKPKREAMQIKMGDISNLITDMTIKGAPFAEIAQAVRHSMVIIDSEKHSLNYEQSYNDNGIRALKTKYQGGPRAGASTLISKASSERRIPERKTHYTIDKDGNKVYAVTDSSFVSKSGKVIEKTDKITAMDKEKDAHKLSSGTQIEGIYADHANGLKRLANEARKVVATTPMPKVNPQAKKIYVKEVAKMEADLELAYRNKPLERQAQLLANRIVEFKKQQYEDLSKADLKKIKGMALTEARLVVGAKKHPVDIDDRQWEAIQMGAITTNVLTKILLNTDQDALKARALPKTSTTIPESKLLRARTMFESGRTRSEIANALGVSASALDRALSE